MHLYVSTGPGLGGVSLCPSSPPSPEGADRWDSLCPELQHSQSARWLWGSDPRTLCLLRARKPCPASAGPAEPHVLCQDSNSLLCLGVLGREGQQRIGGGPQPQVEGPGEGKSRHTGVCTPGLLRQWRGQMGTCWAPWSPTCHARLWMASSSRARCAAHFGAFPLATLPPAGLFPSAPSHAKQTSVKVTSGFHSPVVSTLPNTVPNAQVSGFPLLGPQQHLAWPSPPPPADASFLSSRTPLSRFSFCPAGPPL